MTIATYEQMKRYIESFKNCASYNTPFLSFKIRYYANSIDIMESWRSDRYANDYEIMLSKAETNNFTENTYNRLIGKMLMKIKTNEINKKLDEIKKDF